MGVGPKKKGGCNQETRGWNVVDKYRNMFARQWKVGETGKSIEHSTIFCKGKRAQRQGCQGWDAG